MQRHHCLLLLFVLNVYAPCCLYGHHDEGSILLGAIFPRFSESGHSIVFSYQGSIWRMPRDGGVMTQLTVDEGFDVEATWSPNDKLIAFIRGRDSFVGPLRLINASDGTAMKLTKEIIAKDKLFFDPNGRRILGCFRQEGGRFSICWLDRETGELGEEIRADVWGQRIALSPDGKSIALTTSQDIIGEQGGNNGPQCDVWLMAADGGETEKITRFLGRVYELSWSADNKSLYIVSNVGGVHNDLWRVPLDDPVQGARKLTFGQGDEDRASPSRDGRWLLFTDNRLGPTALVLRDVVKKEDTVIKVARMNYQQATGTIALTVFDKEQFDKEERHPVTARVSVKQIGGKYYAPHGTLYRMLRDDVHFYCTGKSEFELPSGRYVVKVTRGPEYPVVRKAIEIAEGKKSSLVIDLNRWTDQKRLGWYSGESHIHANYGYGQWYNSPRTMLRQCAGEDLNVCNFMVANSEADGVFDREYFRGSPDPLSTKETVLYWNEEFRSTIWGHLTLLNLKQLVEPIFTGFHHTTHPHDHPTNADIADLTHDQDGHVNYTHPAHNVKDPYLGAYSAKALPLDVALGKVDSIDVMGSNHGATMPLWYRLLNCGFHVPASAGTDCFLNRVCSRLPGQDRVYVLVDGEFGYERWIEALKAGRTFVTNGPMFEFLVNDVMPGDTITLLRPGEVHVQADVISQYPMNRVEIIYNSQIVGGVKIEGESSSVSVDENIMIPQTGWIALRAAGTSQADQPDGTVFGHTSPVYIDVEGHPIDARYDAEYFVNWIERLRTDVRRRNRIPSRHQVHVESQMSDAREVFNSLLRATAEND